VLVVAIDRLATRAAIAYQQDYSKCTDDQSRECIEALERDDPDSFRILLALVYEAYYSDPGVLTELERVTGWRSTNVMTGSEMAPFDASLLVRVRSLPPAYRTVD
jgi:hypothetical protein